ncbi:hypothetical protein [Hymenobacter crusticola]|uniref:Uncharacterized protein n=1 Tax=Hymenobacter crusticola TaxID=1770526 RepID=A0A243W871_9BACT|nr:hypothetical protein [Hymenobacter crusticola]OUJ69133.1 hypothetical protein BXP70_26990 [Hymenobacter crusticola]
MIRLTTDDGQLQLPADSLSIDVLNPYFEADAIPGISTQAFALSWTRENLRLLNFPHRYRGAGGPPAVPAYLYLDGPLWQRGALVYRECDEQRQKLTYNFAAAATDLQTQISGVNIRDLNLGSVPLVLTPTAADYALLPVRNSAFYGDKNTSFKGIVNHYRNGGYSTGAAFAICPQPRLVPALRKIMGYFGYTLTGAWLEQEEVQQLVIYSDRAAELAGGGVDSEFKLASYLPSMTVGELLIALQKLFCIGYVFDSKRKEMRLQPLGPVVSFPATYIDRSGFKLKSKPNTTNGFTLQQSPEGDDELDKTLDTGGRQMRVGAGAETIETKAGTLHMVQEQDPHGSRSWLVPAIEAKGASLAYGLGEESRCGLRLFYDRGLQPDSAGGQYPLGTSGTVNYNGASVGESSLLWDGPQGLYLRSYQAWLDFRSRAVETEYEVTFSLGDLLALEPSMPEMIDRHLQLWQKVSLTIDAQRKLAKARITYQEIL